MAVVTFFGWLLIPWLDLTTNLISEPFLLVSLILAGYDFARYEIARKHERKDLVWIQYYWFVSHPSGGIRSFYKGTLVDTVFPLCRLLLYTLYYSIRMPACFIARLLLLPLLLIHCIHILLPFLHTRSLDRLSFPSGMVDFVESSGIAHLLYLRVGEVGFFASSFFSRLGLLGVMVGYAMQFMYRQQHACVLKETISGRQGWMKGWGMT